VQDRVWTIKAALSWVESYLASKGDENPRLSAQLLLAAVTDLSRLELYTNFDKPLSREELSSLHTYVVKRAQGEPIQYITGRAAFRYYTFAVKPGVLIPRPETEVLVSEALALLKDYQDLTQETHLEVADIGCGTGCVGLSIAAECPRASLTELDINPDACALTKENADMLDLGDRIKVVEGDMLSISGKDHAAAFDLIVSNPPYIPTQVLDEIPREVSAFEPREALDGGEDGLDFFRVLIDFAAEALKPHGALAIELFEEKVDEACEYAEMRGFEAVRSVYDLTNRPRIVVARKPSKNSKESQRGSKSVRAQNAQ
jgi:release factor glutamine methyltransferase